MKKIVKGLFGLSISALLASCGCSQIPASSSSSAQTSDSASSSNTSVISSDTGSTSSDTGSSSSLPVVNRYKMAFVVDGGSSVAEIEAEEGKKFVKPADPTKDGFTFGGWYKEASCTNAYDWDTAASGNITLYAKWVAVVPAVKYTLTIDLNNGSNPTTQTISEGEKFVKPANPTDEGYTFEGWFTDKGTFQNEFDFNAAVTGNVTIYAKWVAVPVTITYTLKLGTADPIALTKGTDTSGKEQYSIEGVQIEAGAEVVFLANGVAASYTLESYVAEGILDADHKVIANGKYSLYFKILESGIELYIGKNAEPEPDAKYYYQLGDATPVEMELNPSATTKVEYQVLDIVIEEGAGLAFFKNNEAYQPKIKGAEGIVDVAGKITKYGRYNLYLDVTSESEEAGLWIDEIGASIKHGTDKAEWTSSALSLVPMDPTTIAVLPEAYRNCDYYYASQEPLALTKDEKFGFEVGAGQKKDWLGANIGEIDALSGENHVIKAGDNLAVDKDGEYGLVLGLTKTDDGFSYVLLSYYAGSIQSTYQYKINDAAGNMEKGTNDDNHEEWSALAVEIPAGATLTFAFGKEAFDYTVKEGVAEGIFDENGKIAKAGTYDLYLDVVTKGLWVNKRADAIEGASFELVYGSQTTELVFNSEAAAEGKIEYLGFDEHLEEGTILAFRRLNEGEEQPITLTVTYKGDNKIVDADGKILATGAYDIYLDVTNEEAPTVWIEESETEPEVKEIAVSVNGTVINTANLVPEGSTDKAKYEITLAVGEKLTIKEGDADLHFYKTVGGKDEDQGAEFVATIAGKHTVYVNKDSQIWVTEPEPEVVDYKFDYTKLVMGYAQAGSTQPIIFTAEKTDTVNQFKFVIPTASRGEMIGFGIRESEGATIASITVTPEKSASNNLMQPEGSPVLAILVGRENVEVYFKVVGENKFEVYATGRLDDEKTAASYYVVGSMTDWKSMFADFALHAMGEEDKVDGHIQYESDELEFKEGDQIKVTSKNEGNWYPQEGGNWTITEDGKYKVYFVPEGNGAWDNGYFYVAKQGQDPVNPDDPVTDTYALKLGDADPMGLTKGSDNSGNPEYSVEGIQIEAGTEIVFQKNGTAVDFSLDSYVQEGLVDADNKIVAGGNYNLYFKILASGVELYISKNAEPDPDVKYYYQIGEATPVEMKLNSVTGKVEYQVLDIVLEKGASLTFLKNSETYEPNVKGAKGVFDEEGKIAKYARYNLYLDVTSDSSDAGLWIEAIEANLKHGTEQAEWASVPLSLAPMNPQVIAALPEGYRDCDYYYAIENPLVLAKGEKLGFEIGAGTNKEWVGSTLSDIVPMQGESHIAKEGTAIVADESGLYAIVLGISKTEIGNSYVLIHDYMGTTYQYLLDEAPHNMEQGTNDDGHEEWSAKGVQIAAGASLTFTYQQEPLQFTVKKGVAADIFDMEGKIAASGTYDFYLDVVTAGLWIVKHPEPIQNVTFELNYGEHDPIVLAVNEKAEAGKLEYCAEGLSFAEGDVITFLRNEEGKDPETLDVEFAGDTALVSAAGEILGEGKYDICLEVTSTLAKPRVWVAASQTPQVQDTYSLSVNDKATKMVQSTGDLPSGVKEQYELTTSLSAGAVIAFVKGETAIDYKELSDFGGDGRFFLDIDENDNISVTHDAAFTFYLKIKESGGYDIWVNVEPWTDIKLDKLTAKIGDTALTLTEVSEGLAENVERQFEATIASVKAGDAITVNYEESNGKIYPIYHLASAELGKNNILDGGWLSGKLNVRSDAENVKLTLKLIRSKAECTLFLEGLTVATDENENIKAFYLVADSIGWTNHATGYGFVPSTNEEGQYELKNISLKAGEAFKVVDKDGEVYYPSGDNHIAPKDAEYDIYFRPEGKADWGNAGDNYIWIARSDGQDLYQTTHYLVGVIDGEEHWAIDNTRPELASLDQDGYVAALFGVHLSDGDKIKVVSLTEGSDEAIWHGAAEGFAKDDKGNLLISESGKYDIYLKTDGTIEVKGFVEDPQIEKYGVKVNGEAVEVFDINKGTQNKAQYKLQLQKGDVITIFGAELNRQLYFGNEGEITASDPIAESGTYFIYINGEDRVFIGEPLVQEKADLWVRGDAASEDWNIHDELQLTTSLQSEYEYEIRNVNLKEGSFKVADNSTQWTNQYNYGDLSALTLLEDKFKEGSDKNIVVKTPGYYHIFIDYAGKLSIESVERIAIAYHSNGGSEVSSQEISVNERFTEPAKPTRAGYTFVGWFSDEETLLQAFDFNEIQIENVDVYAKWEVVEYTISYELNGGSFPEGALHPEKYTIESDDIVLGIPEKADSQFLGWYADEALTVLKSSIVKGSTGDLKLYAKWGEVDKFTMDFDSKGGSAVGSIQASDGQAFVKPADPIRAGYSFAGWFHLVEDVETAYDWTAKATANVSLYAKWDLVDYTITYKLDGGSNAEGNPAKYNIEGDDIVLSDATKAGYKFLGWYLDEAHSEEKKIVSIAKDRCENVDLYAAFEAIYIATVGGKAANLEAISPMSNPENRAEFLIELAKDDELKLSYGAEPLPFGENEDPSYKAPRNGVYTIYVNKQGIVWMGAPQATETHVIAHGVGDNWSDTPLTPVEGETDCYQIVLPLLANEEFGFKCVDDDTGTQVEGSWHAKDIFGKLSAGQNLIEVADNNNLKIKIAGEYRIRLFIGENGAIDSFSVEPTVMTYTLVGTDFGEWSTSSEGAIALNLVEGKAILVIETKTANSELKVFASDNSWYGESGINGDGTDNVVIAEPGCYRLYFSVEKVDGKYIRYEKINYTITYDAKGGSAVEKETIHASSTAKFTEGVSTRDGYNFVGWFVDEETKYDFSKPADDDVSVYAKWEAKKNAVTYELNGGQLPEGKTNPTVYTIETADFTLVNPTRVGYDFAGWSGSGIEGTSLEVTIAKGSFGDKAYTANWTAIEYTISYDLDGGALPEGKTNPTVYTIESEDIELNAPVKSGQNFVGWYDGEKHITVIPQGSYVNYELTARYSAKSVLTFFSNGGSEVESQMVDPGQKYTKPANPTRTGYTFENWYADETLETIFNFDAEVSESKTAYAKWTANKYQVIFDKNDEQATGSMEKQEFTYDKASNLSANGFALVGYEFAGWAESADGEVKYADESEVSNLAANGDVTLYAKWSLVEYEITYDYDGGALPAGKENPEGYTITDATFLFEEPVKEGYEFLGWYVDETKVTGVEHGSTGDITVTAHWKQIMVYKIVGDVFQWKWDYANSTAVLNVVGDHATYEFVASATGTIGVKDQNSLWYGETSHEGGNISLTEGVKYIIEFYPEKKDGKYIIAKEWAPEIAKLSGKVGDTDLEFVEVKDEAYAAQVKATATATENAELQFFYDGKAIEGVTCSGEGNKAKYINEKLVISGAGDVAIYLKALKNGTFDVWADYGVGIYIRGTVVSQGWDGQESANALKEPSNGDDLGELCGVQLSEGDFKLANGSWEKEWGYIYEGSTSRIQGGAKDNFEAAASNGNIHCKVAGLYDIYLQKDGYIRIEKVEYTMNFDSKEGSAVASIKVHGGTGEKFVKPADPTKEHYVFKGWFTEGDVAYDWNLVPNADVNVYAKWTINGHTITFDTDGGTSIDPIKADYGASIEAPANPTKEGHTFAGWDKEIPTTMPDEDLTIKAQWKVNQYTITFDTDGGNEIAAITQDYGTAIAKPADPTKVGYTFAGWNQDIPDNMPAENLALKATWTINSHTITFDTDGGTSIAQIKQDYGTDVTAPADPTKVGHTFISWDKAIPEKMPDEDLTIVAQWKVNQYTITFDTDGGSEIAPIIQDYGTAIEAPANPTKANYDFAGWDKKIPATMPAENLELKAKWTINGHTITFDTDGGTSVDPIKADYGASIEAPANPTKVGHTFAGWDREIPTTMPDEDLTIKAMWTVNQYTITFDTDGGTSVDPIKADYGASIEAPANPTKVGHTFAGWDREIPTTMPDEDLTIKAMWTVNQYTITFDTDGGNEIAQIKQNYGTDVTAPADPTKVGHTFISWDKAIPEKMPDEDLTIVAQWKVNQYTITFDTDGGSEIAPIIQDYGTAIEAPANPTKANYDFAGWDKTIPATMPAENLTIKAKWTADFAYAVKLGEGELLPLVIDEEVAISGDLVGAYKLAKAVDVFAGQSIQLWTPDAEITSRYDPTKGTNNIGEGEYPWSVKNNANDVQIKITVWKTDWINIWIDGYAEQQRTIDFIDSERPDIVLSNEETKHEFFYTYIPLKAGEKFRIADNYAAAALSQEIESASFGEESSDLYVTRNENVYTAVKAFTLAVYSKYGDNNTVYMADVTNRTVVVSAEEGHTISAYAYNSDSDKVAEWPGVTLNYDIYTDKYVGDIAKDTWANIIFVCDGRQTADLAFSGLAYDGSKLGLKAKAYICGSFNGWENSIGNESYLMDSSIVDNKYTFEFDCPKNGDNWGGFKVVIDNKWIGWKDDYTTIWKNGSAYDKGGDDGNIYLEPAHWRVVVDMTSKTIVIEWLGGLTD